MTIDNPGADAAARCGLFLAAHGTRDSRGQEAARQLAARVARRWSPAPVALGFLELAEPTIAAGLADLAARGATQIVVAPLLLLAAGHARRDIPEAVGEAVAAYPGVAAVQAAHFGLEPSLLRLAAKRFAQATAPWGPRPAAETLLLVVGRGSSDRGAQAELRQWAALRARQSPVARTEVAYLAMARPTFDEALARAADAGYPRVVVQPHLLFPGELSEGLAARVARQRAAYPGIEWIAGAPLGIDALLVDSVVARARAALPRLPQGP